MPLPQNQLFVSTAAPATLQAYAGAGTFSWRTELRHLASQKFLKISWWPVFKLQQRWFTRSPLMISCFEIPEFRKLWNTIQKGAFAYNSLFLNLSPLKRQVTDLADITTLALFFGDEFIDGLAAAAGKSQIVNLIGKEPERFFLYKRIKGDKVYLQYRFNLEKLLSPEVLDHVNDKYQISYHQFYGLLQRFLALMNNCLSELPFEKAGKAADKIADACNTCFESFLHDVHHPGCEDLERVETVLHFHELKTAYMQEKLLELRCILVSDDDAMHSIHMPGWLDIMRVIQIYDDIQDMIIDDGMQDNLVLSVAFHFFPEEWSWYRKNKNILLQQKANHLLLALYMPCSLHHCMKLAADKIKTMNWEQQKIMHYLLMKHKYTLFSKADLAGRNFLSSLYHQVRENMYHLPEQTVKSFVIDICIHLNRPAKKLLRLVKTTMAYQLKYNLFNLSTSDKAGIFDKIVKN